tara:strand:- start:2254 stop:3099 length:846 start_codon:yes stop_codon:yes gene_type:complete
MNNINIIKKKFINDLSNVFSSSEIISIWNYWVIVEILKMKRIDLIKNPNLLICSRKLEQILDLIKHLKLNKPVQYFFNYTYFKNYLIKINKNVLIPRIETEELIDLVCEYKFKNNQISGIDIGTGSGCISIALSKLLNVQMYAVDYNNKIINVAKKNSLNHNTDIEFYLFDILNSEKFDLLPKADFIVSNPPYVIIDEVDKKSNIFFEPKESIFVDKNNPLIFYKKIIKMGKYILKSNGVYFFEINPKFHDELIDYLNKLSFKKIKTHKDFFGKKRFIVVN